MESGFSNQGNQSFEIKIIVETFWYWGFQEKSILSYLCALGIDRLSPLNERTLPVPFNMKSAVAQVF